MLNTAVNEVGGYLRAARALAVVGTPGRPPELAAEYCAQGLRSAPGAQVVFLLAHMEKAQPDELGALMVETRRPDAFYGRLPALAAEGAGIREVYSDDDNLEAVFNYLVSR